MQALPSHPFDSGTPRKRRTGYSAPALSSDHGRAGHGRLPHWPESTAGLHLPLISMNWLPRAPEARLLTLCHAHGHTSIEVEILHLFGIFTCPHCQTEVSTADALA
jgi:hypothetical protein